MHGSLSTDRTKSKGIPADVVRAYLILGLTGVAAGLLVVHGRLGLGLPGHKALFWMPALIVARMICPARAGATVGATATVATTMLLGGNLAGGLLLMPLIILAGGVFDLAVLAIRRMDLGVFPGTAMLIASGGAANLICFVKKACLGVNPARSLLGLAGPGAVAASYVMFGLIAGLGGGIGAYAALAARRKTRKRDDSDASKPS